MRLLILLSLCLLPLSAFAQSMPPMPSGTNDSVIVLHPAPGVSAYYDQSGNSARVYEQVPGMAFYSTENRYGQITSQGYLFDPMPREKPLSVEGVREKYDLSSPNFDPFSQRRR